MSETTGTLRKNARRKTPFSKAIFEQKNERRIFLIHRQINAGLTPMEAEELECRQNEVMEYVNAKWPLPIETLEHIKAALMEAEQA